MDNLISIIIVHCHDLGRHLGCYGMNSVHSENIDSFAAQGVQFEQSFCTAPSCSPARASLFTGRYPHNTGVMGLCHDNFGWDLNPGERHLAGFLSEAGYRTAAVGITHETSSHPKRWGYDIVDDKKYAEETAASGINILQKFSTDRTKPFFMSLGFLEPHRLPADKLNFTTGMIPGDHDFIGSHLKPDDQLGLKSRVI